MKTTTRIFVCLLLTVVTLAQAYSIALTWAPSPDATVRDYRVYWGTNAHNLTTNRWGYTVVTNMSDDLVVESTECIVSNLVPGVAYYLATVSRDVYGVESAPSNELTVKGSPHELLPALEQVQYTRNPDTQLPQFSFSASENPGTTYLVQTTTNLTDWHTLSTNTSPIAFTDQEAYQYPNRFYRIKPAFQPAP